MTVSQLAGFSSVFNFFVGEPVSDESGIRIKSMIYFCIFGLTIRIIQIWFVCMGF